MKSFLVWLLLCLSLRVVSTMMKVLYDSESTCDGLICDYSYITWEEKVQILNANNELRNNVVRGKHNLKFKMDIINKLAWSEKLATLAQSVANRCPESKKWIFSYNSHCEFVSYKRFRTIAHDILDKNLTSLILKNEMMDFQVDNYGEKFRRASAFAIGCGYVLRYREEKFVDHFVCLYCYVDEHEPTEFIANYTCHKNCIYENFTCDRIYDNLCSYDSKDGNVDAKQKLNALCPSANLLTGTILFWNFMGNSFICLLAAGFLATTVALTIASVIYFSVKNYRRWLKLIKRNSNLDTELSFNAKNTDTHLTLSSIASVSMEKFCQPEHVVTTSTCKTDKNVKCAVEMVENQIKNERIRLERKNSDINTIEVVNVDTNVESRQRSKNLIKNKTKSNKIELSNVLRNNENDATLSKKIISQIVSQSETKKSESNVNRNKRQTRGNPKTRIQLQLNAEKNLNTR